MPRALFEKTGSAIYISHLDLMRAFQRAFKRAGLPLTHTQGYNPRPSVSIALPLSLGTESICELLDFDLDGQAISNEEIKEKLNTCLIPGVKVVNVYDEFSKLKHLALLECLVTLEYDSGIPEDAQHKISELFSSDEILVEKKGKNGIVEQNIAPMIRKLNPQVLNNNELVLHALICCQNPTLNPAQLHAAICKYLPELTPNFVRYRRLEVYDINENVFR